MDNTVLCALLRNALDGHSWTNRGMVVCFCGKVLGSCGYGAGACEKQSRLVEIHFAECGGVENHLLEVAYGNGALS